MLNLQNLHQVMEVSQAIHKISDISPSNFNEIALEIFHFQVKNNAVYNKYVHFLEIDSDSINSIRKIPFMPISFFKTHDVLVGSPDKAEVIYSSSGTTGQQTSRHFVQHKALYQTSWETCFRTMIGAPEDMCILCLLPNYLERTGSSLIDMANGLIQLSNDERSDFYLYDHQKLADTLQGLAAENKKTLLIGVSFALLDFVAEFSVSHPNLIVMETGGMKGRKEEMTRDQLHAQLKKGFNLEKIHSEYGMTELLSQAYSLGDGVFQCPPWMKILIRESSDPFNLLPSGRGAINVIDLANIYSCAFIATDDLGRLDENGNFEVQGRLDNSQIRGCNLLVV